VAVMRPTYWEWVARIETEAARWRTAAVLAVAVALLFAIVLVYQATRPAPVYFLAAGPGALVGGLARADEIPTEVVEGFASQVALVLGNLTPSTAKQSYARLRMFLTPGLQMRMTPQADADVHAIEKHGYSTSFSVRESKVVDAAPSGWNVRVVGRRVSWSGGQLGRADDVAYNFTVVRTARPTPTNPTGLGIEGLSLALVDTPAADGRKP
jgi:hypothetical protein